MEYFSFEVQIEKLDDPKTDLLFQVVKEGKLPFNRFWQKMPRSLGNKRKAIAENGNEKGIGLITTIYGDFQKNEFCKIFPNAFLGYWRVTVERSLKNENGKIVTDKKRQP